MSRRVGTPLFPLGHCLLDAIPHLPILASLAAQAAQLGADCWRDARLGCVLLSVPLVSVIVSLQRAGTASCYFLSLPPPEAVILCTLVG